MIKNKRAKILDGAEVSENQNCPKKRGGKIFRKTAICALAGFMGALGLMGAGCTPSNTNAGINPPATENNVGLITPRADDPVICTTESGLEIKYGNANIIGAIQNGALFGFPYFTTTESSTTYYWVIIGLNLQISDSTPAGTAISSDTNSSLRYFFGSSISIKNNSEIPKNCALVLSNTEVATGIYDNRDISGGSGYVVGQFSGSTLQTTMEGYYTNGTFGLSSIKSSIQTVTIITDEYYSDNRSINVHIFSLHYNDKSGNFLYSTYLTNNQYAASSTTACWLRGFVSYQISGGMVWGRSYAMDNAGNHSLIQVNSSAGYRPAFCMSLI